MTNPLKPDHEISGRRLVLAVAAFAALLGGIPMAAGIILGLLMRHAHVAETLLK